MAQNGDDPVALEEVVVTGYRASLDRSLDRKRQSDLISDSITAEDFGKFPDNNIADSLQRVPGVAIDRAGGEGRFVSIRGLGPDFSSVLINGRSAATENEERAFSFDTLASELVSAVDVFKTSNAGLKEGGLGGTVNIITARPFDYEGLHLVGNVRGMYEENSGDVSPQGSILMSNTFDDGRFGLLASLTYQERSTEKRTVDNEHILNTNVEPFLTFTDPSQGWAGGYAYSGDGLEEDTWRIQALWRGITTETRKRVGGNLVGQFQATDNLVFTADVIHSRYDTSTERHWTGSYLWAPTLSDVNEIDENNFYEVISHGYEEGYDITGYGHALTTTERPTETTVGGLNAVWDISHELTMTADLSQSSALLDNRGRDRMYILEMLNKPGYIVTSKGGIPSVDYEDESGIIPEMGSANLDDLRGRQTSNDGIYNKAENREAKLDFSWVPMNDWITQLDFGANFTSAEKTTEYWQTPAEIRRMYHSFGRNTPIDHDSIITGVSRPGDVFGGLNGDVYLIDPVAYRQWMTDNVDNRDQAETAGGIASREAFEANNNSFDAVRSNDSYNIQEDVLSFYVNGSKDTYLFDRPLNVSAGVRYTETEVTSSGTSQVLVALTPEAQEPGEPPMPNLIQHFAEEAGSLVALDNRYDNWLPSISAKLDVTNDFIIRASASKTLTRPTLSGLAPSMHYVTTTRTTRTAYGSNPNLLPFTSNNLDLSFEYYYGQSNLMALSLFKKDISNFIVSRGETEIFPNIEVDDPEWQEFFVTRPQNSESAVIEGAELNLIHMFDNGFGVSGNYTFVDSNAVLQSGDVTSTFALPGISDTGNLSVFYGNDGFQFRVSYNHRTPFMGRIFNGPSNEPVNYNSYGAVDISTSYDIGDRFTIFLDGSNITGETVNRYGRQKNQFIGYEDTGALYTFGIRASL
ncbi:TonB-dependent receptor [Marinimicrobium alkaliphilum]|uniref:TonB-dependent receptor n=1 Tax=Marinimicrobium alkaliphilum TaxID=2202654 RepID=UPI001300B973|nr:TonB-dependent receptor [Marinimicrobium alkaliphilum]